MQTFALKSDRVSLGVTETGGHLSEITFDIGDGRRVAPMKSTRRMRSIGGDFFCARFGASDVIRATTQRPAFRRKS